MIRAVFVLHFALLLFAGSVRAEDWSSLVEEVMPSTVNIQVVKENTAQPRPMRLEDFFGFSNPMAPPPGAVSVLGSGFFVDEEGHVVTNYHVVSNATQVKVMNHRGDEMDAVVVGVHKDSDLAVVKIQDPDNFEFKKATWGDSDNAKIGSSVMAIGNPYGLSGTVTTGIVSSRGRDIGVGKYDNFIQTDATIDQGNSGGPLFNEDGEVIGVNSMIIISREGRKAGLALAIPSNWASALVEQIIEYGEPRMGAIGVKIESVTPQLKKVLDLPSRGGAVISSVMEGSPSEAAGALMGDVIVKLGDFEIESARDLVIAVAQTQVGKIVSMKVWRQSSSFMGGSRGEYIDLEVEIGLRNAVLGTGFLIPNMGAQVAPIQAFSQEERLAYGLEGEGVAITEVSPSSPAAEAGLAAGDQLLTIAGYRVSTPEEVADIFSGVSSDWTGVVWIRRSGSVQYTIITIP